MKLLYFGTACNEEDYKSILSRCKIKPSIAPFVFESALLTGFRALDVQIEAHAFPMIPAFPHSTLLAWGARKQTVAGGYPCKWIPAVNIVGLKQATQRLSCKKPLRRWLRENRDGAVLMYSIYEPVARNVQKLCRKYGVACYAIVPDLPRDMYRNQKTGKIKQMLGKRYVKRAVAIQAGFDGYIYLTEAMKEEVNPAAPYLVVEAIADIAAFDQVPVLPKKQAMMYAGSLNKKFGIANLIEAFQQFNAGDWELWIFGAGDDANAVEAASYKCRAIQYFGSAPRDTVLQKEREASLLINPRPTSEEYTHFSFPSKTVEYMLSGTPVLTTRLAGIPDAYFDVVFSIPDNRPETIAAALHEITALDAQELMQKGDASRRFVLQNCSAEHQTRQIMEFIQMQGKRMRE